MKAERHFQRLSSRPFDPKVTLVAKAAASLRSTALAKGTADRFRSALHQFHTFLYRRPSGHTIQEHQLICPQAQRNEHLQIKFPILLRIKAANLFIQAVTAPV